MKKFIITNVAVISLAVGAIGQGTITLDNSEITKATSTICLYVPGNFYSGLISMEFWIKNGAPDPSVNIINSLSGEFSGAYSLLAANGWIRESTATVLHGTVETGQFSLGAVTLPDVSPAGATINFAMAAWTGAGSSFTAGTFGGVLAFPGIVTGNPDASPPGTPGDINEPWDKLNVGLIIGFPEPSTFALVGLGAAVLLVFRRRK